MAVRKPLVIIGGQAQELPAADSLTVSLPARATVAYTTASLAAGAVETGAVTMAKGYRLLKVQLSAAARVEVYGTTAERTADANRPWGTDPAQGVGLVLDYLAVAAGTWDLSPTVDGFSTESSPSSSIPIAVTATAAGAVTVTFTWIQTE